MGKSLPPRRGKVRMGVSSRGGTRLRIGVFGGTFDPIHVGHLIAAERATELLRLDEMLFVPAGEPWFKADEPVTAAEHRMNMVRLAVESNPRFRACGAEIARPGPSYTADTLEHLRAGAPDGAEFFLVLGLDALAEMHRWRRLERVFELGDGCRRVAPGRRVRFRGSVRRFTMRRRARHNARCAAGGRGCDGAAPPRRRRQLAAVPRAGQRGRVHTRAWAIQLRSE